MHVYLNGKLIDGKKARISVFDHGYLYGDGVFETMRAYGGRIFLEKEHLDRMGKAGARLGIRLSAKEMSAAIKKTLAKNKLEDAYVRASVSRGTGETGLNSKCGKPTILVIAKPLKLDERIYQNGISCTTLLQDYANPLNAKGLSFLNYVLARRSSKADEVLIIDSSGEVREGCTSNVFVIKNGTVSTPPALGIVDGVTRNAVLRLCTESKIPAEEKKITKEDLLSADECFITNSLKGLVPAVRIDGQSIGSGSPGEITRTLMELYAKLTT